jgi:hypothetical protein
MELSEWKQEGYAAWMSAMLVYTIDALQKNTLVNSADCQSKQQIE